MDESGDEDAVFEKRRSQELEDDAAQTKAIKGTLSVTFGKKRKMDSVDEVDEPLKRSQTLSERKEKELAKLTAAREKRKAELERTKEKAKKGGQKPRDDDDSEDEVGFSDFKPVSNRSLGSKEKSRESAKPAASSSSSKYEVFDTFCENGKYYVLTWIAPESPFTTGYPVTLQKSFPRSSLSTCALIPPGQTSTTMRAYLSQKVADDEFAGVRSGADQIFFFCAVPRLRDDGVSCRLLLTSKKSYTEWREGRPESEKTEKRETASRYKNLAVCNTNVKVPTYRLIYHPAHAFKNLRISLRRSKKPEDAELLKRLVASSGYESASKPRRAKKAKRSDDDTSEAEKPAAISSKSAAREASVSVVPDVVSAPSQSLSFVKPDDWKFVLTKVKDFEITHSLVVSLCQKVDIIGNRLKALLESGNVQPSSESVVVEKKEEPVVEAKAVDKENVRIDDRPKAKKRAVNAKKETNSKKKTVTKEATAANASVASESKKASPASVAPKDEGIVVEAKEKPSVASISKTETGGSGTKNAPVEKKSAAKNVVQSKLSASAPVGSSTASKTGSVTKSLLPKPPLPPAAPPKPSVSSTPVLSSLLADAKKVDEGAKKLKEAADATEASVVASYLADEPNDVEDEVVAGSPPSVDDESCYF